jgi:hypothetical protein
VDNINKERNFKLLARTHNFNCFILPGIEIPEFRGLPTGNIHPLLKIKCSSSIEISRIPPKLKMLTGTYILQTIRTKMYADEDAKCQLCKVETETLEHLLLDCIELSNIPNPILRQIQDIFLHHTEYDLCQQSTSVQMLTDDQIRQIEYQIRKLIYALHSERYKILNIHWKLKKSHK